MIYRSKETVCSITVPRDPEYLALVQDILEHPLVRSMEAYTCLLYTSDAADE